MSERGCRQELLRSDSPYPAFCSGRLQAKWNDPVAESDNDDPPLRQCQKDCLEACATGARVIEMACGTGKTRIMKELVGKAAENATGTGVF